MRILYYNWTPLNVKSTGGGVAVYVHNLIQYICEKSTDDFDVTFLSSGYYFDDTKKEVYIRKEETHPIGSYSIINSPVIAPLGCMSYNGYEMLLKDNKLVEVFDGFIQKYGPFDVVHFQTLEGLSPQVLSLKSKYSDTNTHLFIEKSNFLITLAGCPTAIQYDEILLVTTEFAPIIQPFPIVTPGITITPSPIHTLSPISTGAT